MIAKIANELKELEYTPEEYAKINLGALGGGALGAGLGYTGSAAVSLAGKYKDAIERERYVRNAPKTIYPQMLSEAKARLESAKKALELMTDDLVEGNIKKYPHIAENANEYREQFEYDRNVVAKSLKKDEKLINEISEKIKKPIGGPNIKNINDIFKRRVVGHGDNPTLKNVIKRAPQLNVNRGFNSALIGGLLGVAGGGIAAQHHVLKQREED